MLKDWLGGIADELEISSSVRNQIMVAADEIFTNIATHAYPQSSGTVETAVEFNAADQNLTMTFSDSGVPFDPLEIAEPNVNLPPEERPIGGLGIFLVRKFMDSVEYRCENERNILVLRKCLR